MAQSPNFTDPESRIMPGPGGRDLSSRLVQLSGGWWTNSLSHQVARATNQGSGDGGGDPLNVGAVPREVSGDAPLYYSAKAVDDLCSGRGPVRRAGADLLPRPGCDAPSRSLLRRAICLPGTGMRRKLQTISRPAALALRIETVEPVFGQIGRPGFPAVLARLGEG